tara:strand:+ start:2067 stop:2624 length:558 start_codon:yes stop_codon:yes gene_type:complete
MNHYWGKEMSETRAITYNTYGIKEPINSISSIIAMIYVLHNYSVNIILKNFILLNLICAVIAHSTYNNTAIKLDGLTIVFPILFIVYYYKWYIELIILIIIFIYCLKIKREGLVLLFGLIIIVYNKYDDVINNDNFLIGILLGIIALICRILDEKYPKYWWFYLHSIWHILITISLVFLIDSIKW